MYARAIDALVLAGDGGRAGVVAEQAYRQFADYPDPAAAAVVCHRAAFRRWFDAAPARGLPLIQEALRLFGQAPPSPDHAEALFDYANTFLRSAEGRVEASFPVLNRALAMAEAVGATALIPQILSVLAGEAFVRGQVDEGFTILRRAWNLAQAAEDGPALLWLAVRESDALLKLAKFQSAADAASRGLGAARRAGLEASFGATFLTYNAFEAHLTLGSTAQAAAPLRPSHGRTWAARTGPATPGGGRPKRNWTPGSPPRRRPRRCAPPWPPRTVTSRSWPKSGRSPRVPGSRSTPLQPPATGRGTCPVSADRAGAGGAAAGRRRAQQRSDRRGTVHQPRDRAVHVTNILRKLDVTNRVQAAALAERAGLLDSQQP